MAHNDSVIDLDIHFTDGKFNHPIIARLKASGFNIDYGEAVNG
jgi:hypothetical protein